jgi:acyl-CoA reductase-like NAD-dependent aldehyde dehydrogenase
MEQLTHLPALRHGTPYQSLDTDEIVDIRNGKPLALVSQVNAGLIKRDARNNRSARDALSLISSQQLLQIFRDAGDLFLKSELPLDSTEIRQSSESFIESLSATTGLPHTLCKANMGKIHSVLTNMDQILSGLSRGLPPTVFDTFLSKNEGIEVCFYPVADCLSIVLPSNSPGVNSLWLPALAMKIPVIIKPGREDPWTPIRIIQALYAAGLPREAISFYPTNHEGANVILESCDRGMVFGGESTVNLYANDSRIQIHGAGRSKVLIGNDCVDRWPSYIDVITDSIVANGGRSCINASTIVTPKFGKEIAEELAKRVSGIQALSLEDDGAQLAGFANPKMADAIDATIENGLESEGAEDITGRMRDCPRKIQKNGQTYLLPTIVSCKNFEHPLSNCELLFPYASVVEIPQDEMLEKIGPSLVVTAITNNESWITELLKSPQIDRLNIGATPTSLVFWDQPHEGNLFEFLYRRRAIHQAKA